MLQLSAPSVPTGASFEAASRRLRTRWLELLMRGCLERAHGMEPTLDCRPYGRGDVVFASIRLDDCAAQRLRRSDVEECPPKGFMKRRPLGFETVGRPRLSSGGGPLEADFRVEVEDQRQVGLVGADRQALE